MKKEEDSTKKKKKEEAASMEMEVKRIADDAWFRGHISVGSVGGFQDVLTFNCDHGTDHDIESILTAEEARCRIRPCSEQILTNGLCFKLQIGDVVAASRVPHNRSGNPPQLLYDASIQKINRKRHSSEASCKCNFNLVWLDKEMKGKSFRASARQIYVISQESIESFPVLSQWLKTSTGESIYSRYETSSSSDEDTILLEEDIDKITAIAEETVNLVTTSLNSAKRTLRTRKNKSDAKLEGTLDNRNLKPRLGLLAARAAFATRLAGTSEYGCQDSDEKSKLTDQQLSAVDALKQLTMDMNPSCDDRLSHERDDDSCSRKGSTIFHYTSNEKNWSRRPTTRTQLGDEMLKVFKKMIASDTSEDKSKQNLLFRRKRCDSSICCSNEGSPTKTNYSNSTSLIQRCFPNDGRVICSPTWKDGSLGGYNGQQIKPVDQMIAMEENNTADGMKKLRISKVDVTDLSFSNIVAKDIPAGRDNTRYSKRLRTSDLQLKGKQGYSVVLGGMEKNRSTKGSLNTQKKGQRGRRLTAFLDKNVRKIQDRGKPTLKKSFPIMDTNKIGSPIEIVPGNSRCLSPMLIKKEELNELEQLYQHKHAEHGIMVKSKPDDLLEIQLIVELPIDAA